MKDAVTLYAGVGATLAQYAIDVGSATLARRDSLALPEGVQYAWRHGSSPFLYVACSDGKPGFGGSRHFACALRMDAGGALSPHGESVVLRSRPVHITLDAASRHALITYPWPSAISVHRIRKDGTLGEEVEQAPFPPLPGIAHQMRVSPGNDLVFLPLRGTDAATGRPEDPGALAVFDYRDGRLAHRQTIAPDGGYGFGPRHVDFHPSRPWLYASIERQNQVALFELAERVLGPKYRATTLARPAEEKPRQLAGAIHVHPNGRFVYVSNRADGTLEIGGRKVFNGGENTIAVFAIDPATGEPRMLRAEDTRGMHARTFAIDPTGRLLIAANMTPRDVAGPGTVSTVPACLSVFRIREDGTLAFASKYDVDVGDATMFWMGMASLPQEAVDPVAAKALSAKEE